MMIGSGGVATAEHYDYSFVTTICSPTDFGGMGVYLLDSPGKVVPPSGEYVRIELWGALERFAHKTFLWRGGRPTFDDDKPSLGDVRLCEASAPCRRATAGFVSLNGISRKGLEPRRPVEGRVDFQFEGGVRIRQRFKAAIGPWGICP